MKCMENTFKFYKKEVKILFKYKKKKYKTRWRLESHPLAPRSRFSKGKDIHKNLRLITRCSVGSRKGLVHQPPILDLFKITVRGNVQVSIEECDLFEGFIKTLSILLDRLPFKAFSILSLGLKYVFELSHFNGIEVLTLFEFFSPRR